MSVRMRIDREGGVRWAWLTDSTLGDRDAEHCVLDLVRGRTWPRPLSGDGLAESSFEVEPGEAPATWPPFKVSALTARAIAATRSCRKGKPGTFRATAYVGPKGAVIAAGVAPPDPQREDTSDCISDALRTLRLGNLTVGQRTAAKISFLIR